MHVWGVYIDLTMVYKIFVYKSFVLPFHKESGEVQQRLYELPYYEVIFVRVCCSFFCHV
jgi:hypothetical protein